MAENGSDAVAATEQDQEMPVEEASATPESESAPSSPPPPPPRRVVPMTVAVTGATGFVGRHVCAALADDGHQIRALVRDPGKAKVLPTGVRGIEGNVLDADATARLLEGADACVHLIGIIEEDPARDITFERLHVQATENVVRASESMGVARYLHMSALGARFGAPSDYHRTKFEAEQIVRRSRLPWTIFRPSLIHGPDGEFTEMVAAWCRGKAAPFVFLPYFGSGPLGRGRKYRVQPVFVGDVAASFREALARESTVGEVFPIGGPDVMTWPEMLERFRDALPHVPDWRKPVAVPAWYADFVARSMSFLGLDGLVPFNHDQVLMSQEDSVCDVSRMREYLGVDPVPFDEALGSYVNRL